MNVNPPTGPTLLGVDVIYVGSILMGIAAAAMLGWLLTRGLDAWMVICIGVMILIELIPGRDVIGGRLADIKLAYGSVGICAFMAMLGALRVMVRASRSAA